jgi:hypothetical protein
MLSRQSWSYVASSYVWTWKEPMVIFEGRTASALNTKKKGVSPVGRLGNVCLPHSAHGSSSIHFAMLLQAIISVSLDTLEDFYIASFNLAIALRMSNGCIAYLNA